MIPGIGTRDHCSGRGAVSSEPRPEFFLLRELSLLMPAELRLSGEGEHVDSEHVDTTTPAHHVYPHPYRFMGENDIVGALVGYYEAKLDCFGATARGVDWKDEASQRKRFDQLVRVLRLDQHREPFSVVDFGCGYGALRRYLQEQELPFSYTGYDRSEKMIAAARLMHPEGAFTTDWTVVPDSDFVVATGVFNVRLDLPDDVWRDHVIQSLEAMASKARVGLAADFLTSHADADRKRADLYYADPAVIFDWYMRSVSRWVALLHDSDLYEFTVAAVRRPW
ncbi:MAG TPA: class I SAM-dependent methyltransferase [Thermoanaerobaculia bacterium]|nr:class I SAM-dependent methyltransferase [Thermoanaerobaculia bacterium]